MVDLKLSGSIFELFLNPSQFFAGVLDPFLPLVPSLILICSAMALLCLARTSQFAGLVAGITTTLALVIAVSCDQSTDRLFFNEMLAWTTRSHFVQLWLLTVLGLTILVGLPLAKQAETLGVEFFALLQFAAAGAIQISMANHFMALFLAIELMSLPLYILCAFRRGHSRSREAGFKYFMAGAFSIGFFLMGSAYIYGAVGSLHFSQLLIEPLSPILLAIGLAFLLASLAFKAALFPFHAWLPDVYEGAPAPVTGFMASAVKMAVFALLITLVYHARLYTGTAWEAALKWMIILSMSLANLAALRQKSFKRMLAYSSIAHVAYTMIAVVASSGIAGSHAVQAVLVYVVIYGMASLGIFATLAYLDPDEAGPFYYSKLQGLVHRQPWIAVSLALFMVSLAGIPPAAGFIGKFYLFGGAIRSGHWDLALVAIANSLVSIYYYARPVVEMMMRPLDLDVTSPQSLLRPPLATALVILFTLFGVLWIGCFPNGLLRMAAGL